MLRKTSGWVALVLIAGCDAGAPKHPELTGRTEEYPHTGTVVADTFSIFVRLPPEYEAKPDQRFPLVLQLDANLEVLQEFQVTAGFASELEARGTIPPTVVVGIGYPYATESKKGRDRDYTLPLEHPDTLDGTTSGGAPRFLQYLRDELVPMLEGRYRLLGPEHRALSGHSLGGLFTTYALFEYDPERPFVKGFVAASPSLWFDSGSIYGDYEKLKARTTELPVIVYTTVGGLENPGMTVYFDDLTQRLRDDHFGSLKVSTAKYDTDHLGTVAPSFRDGLVFLFQNGLGATP